MKRSFLKVLTATALVAILGSAFIGCGNTQSEPKEQEGEKKELNIAIFEGGYGKDYWEEVVKKFEGDNPDVKVNMEINPKIGDIIRPKITSGNPPDFIYLGSNNESGIAQALIKDKALEDLSDLFESDDPDGGGKLKDKILPGFLDNNLTSPYGDGKVYLAPLYYGVTGLWYNSEYFKEKGYEAPETWEEFFALGDKAKADGKALYTYQGLNPGYNEAVMISSLASVGGQKLVDNVLSYEEGTWKTEEAQKVLGVFNDIAQKGYLLDGTVAMNHTQAQTEFLQGKALFIPNGNWFEGEMKDAIPESGFKFGFMPAPAFNKGDQRYAMSMIEEMYIPKAAKNKDLAKEFLKYQYKNENVKLNAEKSGGVVPIKGGIELAKPYLPESNYNCFMVFENGIKPVFQDFKPTPNVEVKVYDEIYNPIGSLMNKEITVDQWTERIESATAKVREAQK